MFPPIYFVNFPPEATRQIDVFNILKKRPKNMTKGRIPIFLFRQNNRNNILKLQTYWTNRVVSLIHGGKKSLLQRGLNRYSLERNVFSQLAHHVFHIAFLVGPIFNSPSCEERLFITHGCLVVTTSNHHPRRTASPLVSIIKNTNLRNSFLERIDIVTLEMKVPLNI